MEAPSLLVVGTGIRIFGQMTTETGAWIRSAAKVYFLVYDPLANEVITGLNPTSESLTRFYKPETPRRVCLERMVEHVLNSVRSGVKTCLVLLGHPGVFSWLGHETVRRALLEGFSARMLPAISSEDCLFADLGLDPASSGCQSFEATDYLLNGRRGDPSSLLVLWQVRALGDMVHHADGYDLSALPILIERLAKDYSLDHEVIVYEAPLGWNTDPFIKRIPLGKLSKEDISARATLCIPPGRHHTPDAEAYRRLGLPMPIEEFESISSLKLA